MPISMDIGAEMVFLGHGNWLVGGDGMYIT